MKHAPHIDNAEVKYGSVQRRLEGKSMLSKIKASRQNRD